MPQIVTTADVAKLAGVSERMVQYVKEIRDTKVLPDWMKNRVTDGILPVKPEQNVKRLPNM